MAEDRMNEQEVEKTRNLNKMTIKANLNFNVNSFKNWMKQKLKDDNKMFDNNGTPTLPKFSGSHIALTAMNEKLCYMILEKVIERLTKDKTGIYNIRFQDLADVIKIEPNLRKNLFVYIDVFDSTLNYKDQYCIDEKTIKKYIDKVFSASIDITNDAFNFLVYLLLKSCIRIIDTAFIMIRYANRRSLNPNVILECVSVHFTGVMEHLLRMRIDEAIKSCGKSIKEKEEKPVEQPEEKEDDVEDNDDEPVEQHVEPVPVVEEKPIEEPTPIVEEVPKEEPQPTTEVKKTRKRKN